MARRSAVSAATPSSVVDLLRAAASRRSTPRRQRALRVAAAAYMGIGTQIDITGYADKTGNAAANVELAQEARASPCATSSCASASNRGASSSCRR